MDFVDVGKIHIAKCIIKNRSNHGVFIALAGRLTSAWNWCSKLESKPYFPVFLLTGFSGFDGEFA